MNIRNNKGETALKLAQDFLELGGLDQSVLNKNIELLKKQGAVI